MTVFYKSSLRSLKKAGLLFILPIISFAATAASRHEDAYKGLQVGVGYSRSTFIDVSLVSGRKIWANDDKFIIGFSGFTAGGSFHFNNENAVVAAKVGYEYVAVWLFAGKLDCAYYTDTDVGDLRLVPQLGFSLVGLVNLYYGYKIPLAGYRLDPVGRHCINLTCNLNLFR
jgi:hypothetical protein